MTRVLQLPFVGRDDELAALHDAVEDARQGRTVAVFVGGDGGIGKTRLLSEFADSIDPSAAAVLRGACIDINSAPPCWPLIDALRRLLRQDDVDWAREAIAPWRAQLSEAFPAAEWAVERPGAPGPEYPGDESGETPAPPGAGQSSGAADGTERMPTLELLFQVLTTLAGHRPMVVVLEDLHWADRSTRDLLVYLLASLSLEPMLLVASYRTDVADRGAPLRSLLAELRRHSQVHCIDLESLSPADVRVLADTAAGGRAAPAFADRVWELSEGHPLFVEEILRAGSASPGTLARVPANLRQLLADRVALLPAAAQRVVRALAVGQEPVDHRLLLAVVDLPEAELLDALRAAVDGYVLAVDPGGAGYRFRHVLIKHAVYDDLLQGERLGLHRNHALALMAARLEDSARSRLAYHWQQAEDWPRAFTSTVAAARRAERLHAFAEAYRHWAEALELVDRAGEVDGGLDRATLLDNAARAAHLCGEHDGAVGLMARRLALADAPVADGALRHRQAQYLVAAGRVREAVEAYRQAAGQFAASGGVTLEQADTAAGYAEVLLLTGRYGESRTEAERALAMADAAGSRSGMVQALAALGFSKAYLRDHDAGLGDLRRALKIAEATTGRPEDVGRAFVHLAELLSGPLNRLAEGVAVAREGAERADVLGVGRTFGVSLRAIAVNGMFRLGQWAETEQVVAAALAWRPTGHQAVDIRLARCRILIGQGRFTEAHADLDAAEALTVEAVGLRHKAPLLTLRAGLAIFEGRYDDAREAVAHGLDVAEAGSDDSWVLAPLVWHGLRVEAEDRREGRRRRGRDGELVRRLLGHVEQLRRTSAAPAVTDVVRGHLDLCEAEAGRAAHASDPQAWASAAQTWEQLSHPYPAAYARLQQAEALFAERTRNAEAARHLLYAHQTAQRLGAVPFRRQVEALAARARIPLPDAVAAVPGAVVAVNAGAGLGVPSAVAAVPSRRSPRTVEPDALRRLTDRELTVLREIAEGGTNRQIAAKLFISEKTVSAHISHILNKLEVRSRVQASAIFLHHRHESNR